MSSGLSEYSEKIHKIQEIRFDKIYILIKTNAFYVKKILP